MPTPILLYRSNSVEAIAWEAPGPTGMMQAWAQITVGTQVIRLPFSEMASMARSTIKKIDPSSPATPPAPPDAGAGGVAGGEIF